MLAVSPSAFYLSHSIYRTKDMLKHNTVATRHLCCPMYITQRSGLQPKIGLKEPNPTTNQLVRATEVPSCECHRSSVALKSIPTGVLSLFGFLRDERVGGSRTENPRGESQLIRADLWSAGWVLRHFVDRQDAYTSLNSRSAIWLALGTVSH